MVGADLFSTLSKNGADGEKWLSTGIINSTSISFDFTKIFHSTRRFVFLAVVAMETIFKDFGETGQNFSQRKLKIGTFQVDC